MLTYEQAGVIAPSKLARGIAKTVAGSDPLMPLLPFARSEGAGFDYLREGSEIVPAFIEFGGIVNTKETKVLKVHADLATMSDEIRLPGPTQRYMDPDGDQMLIQIRALLKAQVRKYMDKLWNGNRPTVTFTLAGVTLATGGAGPNLRLGTGHLGLALSGGGAVKKLQWMAPGDTAYGDLTADLAAGDPQGVVITSADGVQKITVNIVSGSLGGADVEVPVAITTSTNEFDGVRRLADTSLVDLTLMGANGGPYVFDCLRRAIELNEADDGQKVLCMHPTLIRRHRELLDVRGTPPEIAVGYAPGRKYLEFEGLPVVPVRHLPVNLSKGTGVNLTEVWCVTLGVPSEGESKASEVGYGLCGAYGGRGKDGKADQAKEAEGRTWFGVSIEDIGKIQGKDQYGTAVTFDAGCALYSPLGASCVRYIETA